MNWKRSILALVAGAIVVAPIAAGTTTTVTETFDGTLAGATWRLGTLDETVPAGGSPGGYLRNRQLDAAIPTPIFVGASPSAFLGDYRATSVTSLGLDVNVFAVVPHIVGQLATISLL